MATFDRVQTTFTLSMLSNVSHCLTGPVDQMEAATGRTSRGEIGPSSPASGFVEFAKGRVLRPSIEA